MLALLRVVLDGKLSLVVRVEDSSAYEVKYENEITAEARAAGVIRDAMLVRIGSSRQD